MATTYPVRSTASSGGGGGVPAALTSNRTLTDDDNGKTLVADAARTATVAAGLASGFGVSVVPFASTTLTITGASGVTVNGTLAGSVTRTAASNQIVAVVQIAANSYLVTGV